MSMTTRKAQLGLNLVELMIGLVVGLIVLAAMTVVYLNASRGSKDTLNANRLNQDLRAVMDIMVADIRRAGYWGTAAAGSTNPFTVRGGTATDIYIPTSDCILYSYDATYKDGDTTGTPAAGTDYFGFKLNGDAIWMATNFGDTSQTDCTGTLGWERLTDPAVIDISALSFSTGRPSATEQGSQCLNADTAATWTVRYNATPETVAACACADTTTCPGYVLPTAGNRLAETRQITITITASHVADSTLTRTLTESVLVRNNRLCTFGTNC